MNILMQNSIKTMSSHEIAQVTSKTHSNVLRDIRNMLDQIDKSVLNYQQYQVVTDEQTKRTSEIKLDKNLTITLIAGYNPDIRYRIVKRWQELEAQASQPVIELPDFTNPAEAAIAWAEEYKAKAAAQEQLVLAQPKIEHYNRVVDRHTLLTATQVGQKVGLSAVKLNRVLDELKVYNQAVKRSRVFNSWFIQQGLGELKQTPEGHSQALFSLKGEAWVIERLASEGVA